MITSVVDVNQRVIFDSPLETFQLCDILPDLKGHIKEGSDYEELGKLCVLVVFVDLFKVALKLWIL